MSSNNKLSISILMIMGFSLILFYQNCSPQGEDLGGLPGISGDNGDNGGNGNGGGNTSLASCTRISVSPAVFRVRVPNTVYSGQAPVICIGGNFGSSCSALDQPAQVPSNTCPCSVFSEADNATDCQSQSVPNTLATNNQCPEAPSGQISYRDRYKWVPITCGCVANQGWQFDASINGFKNDAWNINRYLSLGNVQYVELYFKPNRAMTGIETSASFSSNEGKFVRCDL